MERGPPAESRICRVCLADGAQLPLFADELHVKVMACSSVRICEEDGFPANICTPCFAMLNTAFEFKKKCESSDVKLRSCLKDNLKVEEEDEEEHEDEYGFDFAEDDLFAATYENEDLKSFPMEVDVKLFESKDEVPTEKKKINKKKKKWKSTKDQTVPHSRPQRKGKKGIIKKKRIVSNGIASSLLEGKCIWNGSDWRFEVVQKDSTINNIDELATIKKEKDAEEIRTKERKKEKRKLCKKIKTISVNLCDTCGKTFKSKYHLKYHIVLKHQEHKGTVKCLDPDCKKMFKLDNYMIRHVKRCHSAKREFICNECGKQYAFISGLKQHMKSHSENPVWKHCNYCTQKYRTQKSVDIHIRSVHTGERPSVCSVCDSAFFHDDYLKEHMRLHTGETPYKCPICKRGYAQRGNMKSHLKQHRLSEVDEATKATMKPNYLQLLRNC